MAINKNSYEEVKNLLEQNSGVQERPLYYLFGGIHESHFQGLDLLEIDQFKERISNKFSGKDPCLPHDIEMHCRMAELFIQNPTPDLYKTIENESKSSYNKFRLLPFFAWAAINNRADLLNTECFARLFVKYPEAAAESLKIAVAFGSKDYVRDAIIAIGINTVRTALSIAAASYNQEMLVCIVDTLQKFGLTLKDISYNSVTRGDPFLGSIGKDEPLFWAIRSDNIQAVEYLLQNGIDPNNYKDAFSGENHLYLAMRMKNIKVVKMLLEYGADVACKDKLKRTPLHAALEYEQWDVAYMLIKDHNADISAADYRNKTPLDLVKDKEIKEKIFLYAGTNSIETGSAVIEKLKPKSEPKSSELNSPSEELVKPSFTTRRISIFAHNTAKEMKKDNTIESQVIDKLSTLFGVKCELTSILDHWHIIKFSSEQTFEDLEKWSELLSCAGLKIKLLPASSLFDGLVKIPAKLEIHDSLVEILKALDNSLTSNLSFASKARI